MYIYLQFIDPTPLWVAPQGATTEANDFVHSRAPHMQTVLYLHGRYIQASSYHHPSPAGCQQSFASKPSSF
jgi:hypothetical protein